MISLNKFEYLNILFKPLTKTIPTDKEKPLKVIRNLVQRTKNRTKISS